MDEYFCSHYLYDIAVTISGFCFEKFDLNINYLKNLLKGYETQRKLLIEEWKNLKMFVLFSIQTMVYFHLN